MQSAFEGYFLVQTYFFSSAKSKQFVYVSIENPKTFIKYSLKEGGREGFDKG